MRVIGLLLGLHSLILLTVSSISARGTLFWVIGVGATAGMVGGSLLAAWRQQGFAPAFVGAGVFLAIGLGFLSVRIAFILEHGAMDGPRGYGSPAAFLIGLGFEQMVFTLPAAGLLLALRREYQLETDAA